MNEEEVKNSAGVSSHAIIFAGNLSRSPPPPHPISSQPVASATHMVGSPPVAFPFASASCLGSRSVDGQYRRRKIEE
nr:hypothetical protein Itr_chr15CG07330 [Ipomoea trifida]